MIAVPQRIFVVCASTQAAVLTASLP
jgi:hypothetical protein